MSVPVFNLPASAPIATEGTEQQLHRSIKDWEGFEGLGLPKAIFFKSSKITSPQFLASNPLIAKLKQRGRVVAYGYQRANRAKDHGEPLVQKKFSIRQSLAAALESYAEKTGRPQVELVESALGAYLADNQH